MADLHRLNSCKESSLMSVLLTGGEIQGMLHSDLIEMLVFQETKPKIEK